jgi:hypothetical protein
MTKTLIAALAAFGLAYAGIAPAFAFSGNQPGETDVPSSVNHGGGGSDSNTTAYKGQVDHS